VPLGDEAALATAVARLYGDEQLRSRLARAALLRVREAYTVERMVASTVAVYEVARNRLFDGDLAALSRRSG